MKKEEYIRYLKRNLKEWYYLLESILLEKSTIEIFKYLKQLDTEIFPKNVDVFNCFKYCNIKDLKVVMLGDCPYSSNSLNDGLAFSSKYEIPPLLEIFLKEIESDVYNDFNLDRTTNPSLLNIASQGVLLLNVSLTREKNKVHYNLWENFIKKTLIKLQQEHVGIIYVFLGKNTTHFKSLISTKTNTIVECPPLALDFNRSIPNQFLNSKVFSSINSILLNQNGKEYVIKW